MQTPGVIAIAFSSCTAFAALLPLGGVRAVPGIARAAFALALTPLAAAHLQSHTPHSAGIIVHGVMAAASGASIGLCASAIAGAAGAAGSLIDQALAAGPPPDAGGERGVGGFTFLLPLLFVYILCSTGGMTRLMVIVAADSNAIIANPENGAHLASWSCLAAILLALPPLCAHAVATLAAGTAARIAPRINGMLLAPAIGPPLTLVVILAGAGGTIEWLRRLAVMTVHVVGR